MDSHRISHFDSDTRASGDIGRYTLDECLETGVMGDVWRGRDRRTGRWVAIKLLASARLAARSSDKSLIRFRREFELTASLSSPHTVAVLDDGVTRDGRPFYVMEFLRGIDLSKLVDRFGPQPAPRVIHFLRQACRGLMEAHSLGLLHRDIKPANLVTSRQGAEFDVLKLIDFGNASDGEVTGLTAPNCVSGTPAFLAPERVTGGTIDGRSDLYSLGCVAYWLLTGELVFSERNLTNLILAHVRDQPTPPSQRAPIELPQGLEDIVLACLAKDPRARPHSARELWQRLSEVDIAPWSSSIAELWWRTNLSQHSAHTGTH